MRVLGFSVGLVALFAAGSASATVVYDTITAQPVANSNLLTTNNGLHAPFGIDFASAVSETINSVTVDLIDQSTPGPVTDAGSVLVYLVQGTGTPSLPEHSGTTLTNPILLGTILDTQLIAGTGNTVQNLITLTTNAAITAGTWWIELTSGDDPNNGGNAALPTTTAKLAESLYPASGYIGVQPGWLTSGTNAINTDIIGGVNNHSTAGSQTPNDEVGKVIVDATVNTPEPTSLAILGVGLVGLGIKRRLRSLKKQTA